MTLHFRFPLALVLVFGSVALAVGQGTKDSGQAGRVDSLGDPLPTGAIARLGTERLAHWGVHALTFSPDGHTLATAGGGKVVLWDVKTGKALRQWSPPKGWRDTSACSAIAFSPNGRLLAAACSDKALHMLDTATLKQVVTAVADFADALAFAPDGESVAAASCSGVRVYAVSSGKMLHHVVGCKLPLQIAISAEGKTIVAIGYDNYDLKDLKIHRWDAKTGELAHTRTIDIFNVPADRLSPDGEVYAIPARRLTITHKRVEGGRRGRSFLYGATEGSAAGRRTAAQ